MGVSVGGESGCRGWRASGGREGKLVEEQRERASRKEMGVGARERERGWRCGWSALVLGPRRARERGEERRGRRERAERACRGRLADRFSRSSRVETMLRGCTVLCGPSTYAPYLLQPEVASLGVRLGSHQRSTDRDRRGSGILPRHSRLRITKRRCVFLLRSRWDDGLE